MADTGDGKSSAAGADEPGDPRERVEETEGVEVDVVPTDILSSLARLDLEAALAYEAAAELSPDDEVARQLRSFARDHRRHAGELNRVLEGEGEAAIEETAGDAPVLAGIMRLAGPLGPDVIVVALLGNEQLTTLGCDAAVAYSWGEEVQAMLERFAADERRHLAWLAERHDALSAHAHDEDQSGALQ